MPRLRNDFVRLAPDAEVLVIEQLVMVAPKQSRHEPGTTALFLGRADWHQKGIDLLIGALELVDIPGLVVEIAGFDANDPAWVTVRPEPNVSMRDSIPVLRERRSKSRRVRAGPCRARTLAIRRTGLRRVGSGELWRSFRRVRSALFL